ncbi:MAG: FHA domain-containing protein, partial [Inquilinus sp.]|nr:FHA domain-containing protein [Inquilinus sp.]
LTHEGGVYRMGDRVQSIVIGRDERCDLIVSSYFASRRHAVVEKRRDRFILTDESSNGTFVVPRQSAEIYMKRESLPLIGRGTISLGAAPGGADPDP